MKIMWKLKKFIIKLLSWNWVLPCHTNEYLKNNKLPSCFLNVKPCWCPSAANFIQTQIILFWLEKIYWTTRKSIKIQFFLLIVIHFILHQFTDIICNFFLSCHHSTPFYCLGLRVLRHPLHPQYAHHLAPCFLHTLPLSLYMNYNM